MNLEPIRALLELGKREATTTFQSIEAEKALVESLPALSQLLEAVTNLEKLEAEWRETELELTEVGSYDDGFDDGKRMCADSLHRLLHPEDTK